jgi:hypothetical protein
VAAFYMRWIRDLGQNGYGPTDGLHGRVEDVPSDVFSFLFFFFDLVLFLYFLFLYITKTPCLALRLTT